MASSCQTYPFSALGRGKVGKLHGPGDVEEDMRGFHYIIGVVVLLIVIAAAWSAPDNNGLTEDIKASLKQLRLLHGAPVSDATFDQKVVIVTFFASWCAPCREEFRHLRQLHAERHQTGLEVIAVNLFEEFDNFSDDQRLAKFLSLTDPPFTVVKGNDLISRQFGTIRRIPTLFIFDRQGQHVLRFANEVGGQQMSIDLATLRQVVAGLL